MKVAWESATEREIPAQHPRVKLKIVSTQKNFQFFKILITNKKKLFWAINEDKESVALSATKAGVLKQRSFQRNLFSRIKQ